MKQLHAQWYKKTIIKRIGSFMFTCQFIIGSMPFQPIIAYGTSTDELSMDSAALKETDTIFDQPEAISEEVSGTDTSITEESMPIDETINEAEDDSQTSMTESSSESQADQTQESSDSLKETEQLESAIHYDPQPESKADVEAAIATYEKQLDAGNKPRWEFNVVQEWMPMGYYCDFVDNDEEFVASYYTFFNEIQTASATIHSFSGTTRSELAALLNSDSVKEGDTIALKNPVSFDSEPIKVNKTLTIRSENANDPVVLTKDETSSRHFLVADGKTFTLADISLNGMFHGGGIETEGSGTFVMMEGTTIMNSNQAIGGAVYISPRGTFLMEGGTLTNNVVTNGRGGGVMVDGDQNNGGTFTMNGGQIMNNLAPQPIGNNLGNGAGVYVERNGRFTLRSGVISGNQAAASGGGVFANDGAIITIAGGEIISNRVVNVVSQGGGGGSIIFGVVTQIE